MPTLQTLITFFGVAVLLGLSPGPDNLFVLLQSAQRGWRMGIAAVVGLCMGIIVHTTAVALGLAAVFAASAMAFTILKWCGAAYLVYLAWGAWRAPVSAKPEEDISQSATKPVVATSGDFLRMVLRGVVMNLTNPKVLIFFLAFLPQFADPAIGPVGPQIFVFGAVFILAAFLVFGAIALFSGAFGNLLLRSPRAQFWLNKITAVVFVGLAVKRATAQR